MKFLECAGAGAAEFSVTYTTVNPNPFKPVAIGKDREATGSTFLATAVNDAGSGLLHKLSPF